MTYPAICDAIRLKHVIRLVYHGGAREVEPYIYGRSATGDELFATVNLPAPALMVSSDDGRSWHYRHLFLL